MKDLTFKICIFGDGGVGKTTFTQRYLTGLFKADMRLTIGTNFFRKSIIVEHKEVSLQIWDFGGERSFRSIFPQYLQGSSGAIFMYDITRFVTLKNVGEWMNIVHTSLKDSIPIILVGGKLDLEKNRAMDKLVAENIAKEYNFLEHIECSAKTGHNIEKIFYDLTYIMMKNANLLYLI